MTTTTSAKSATSCGGKKQWAAQIHWHTQTQRHTDTQHRDTQTPKHSDTQRHRHSDKQTHTDTGALVADSSGGSNIYDTILLKSLLGGDKNRWAATCPT